MIAVLYLQEINSIDLQTRNTIYVHTTDILFLRVIIILYLQNNNGVNLHRISILDRQIMKGFDLEMISSLTEFKWDYK